MNQHVVVALFALVAGTCVQSRVADTSGRFEKAISHSFYHSSRFEACYKYLAPTAAEREQSQAAVRSCIAEQEVEVIIDGLEDLGGVVVEVNDDAVLMEAIGYPNRATALRKCIARRTDMLQADGTFDMKALKSSISVKVTGLPVEANTRLGLENCPDVEEFDVAEYLQCIGTYCVTGAPPYRR